MQVGQQGGQIKLGGGGAAITRQLGIGQGHIGQLPAEAAAAHLQRCGVVKPHLAGVAHDAQLQGAARMALAISHHLPALVVEVAQTLEAAHHRGAIFVVVGVH